MITVTIPVMILDYDDEMKMYCYRIYDEVEHKVVANFYFKPEEVEQCKEYVVFQRKNSGCHQN